MDNIKTESVEERLMKIGMGVVDTLTKRPYESQIIHMVSIWDGGDKVKLRVEDDTELVTEWRLSELVALEGVKKFRRNRKRSFPGLFASIWRDEK